MGQVWSMSERNFKNDLKNGVKRFLYGAENAWWNKEKKLESWDTGQSDSKKWWKTVEINYLKNAGKK